MDLDLRLFRYFVVLAEERHFARAAERLSITPPTLTHQIKALETRLGVRLCNRKTSARLELTEAGRRFLDQARHVLRQAEEAELAAQKAARGEIGSIEIGYMMSVATSGLMQKYVGAFRRANPGIDVNFRRMPTHRRRSRRSSKGRSTSGSRDRRATIRPSWPASGCSPSRWWSRCRATIRWRAASALRQWI